MISTRTLLLTAGAACVALATLACSAKPKILPVVLGGGPIGVGGGGGGSSGAPVGDAGADGASEAGARGTLMTASNSAVYYAVDRSLVRQDELLLRRDVLSSAPLPLSGLTLAGGAQVATFGTKVARLSGTEFVEIAGVASGAEATPTCLTSDANNAYWIESDSEASGGISVYSALSTAAPTDKPRLLGQGFGQPRGSQCLFAGATQVFAVVDNGAAFNVLRGTKQGGALEIFVTLEAGRDRLPSDFAAQGETLFGLRPALGACTDTCDGDLVAYESTGKERKLVTGLGVGRALVLEGTRLFWLEDAPVAAATPGVVVRSVGVDGASPRNETNVLTQPGASELAVTPASILVMTDAGVVRLARR
jgi:hypothetical protein